MKYIGIISAVLFALLFDVYFVGIIIERGGICNYIATNPMWDAAFFPILITNAMFAFAAWCIMED